MNRLSIVILGEHQKKAHITDTGVSTNKPHSHFGFIISRDIRFREGSTSSHGGHIDERQTTQSAKKSGRTAHQIMYS